MELPNKKGAAKPPDSSRALEGYETWQPQQLAEYLQTVGLGDYY
jgi:hypothetical protein